MKRLLLFLLAIPVFAALCLAEAPPGFGGNATRGPMNDDDLILFHPLLFSGTAFPTCDFEHPAEITGLIGPYKLTTRFYSADFHPVDHADKPGRYGAIIDVHTARGLLETRYQTVYKLPAAAIDWPQLQIGLSAAKLASGFGLDSTVVNDQIGALARSRLAAFRQRFYSDVTEAETLAALDETPPGSPRLANPGLFWPEAVDYVWWDQFRARIGALYTLKSIDWLPVGYEADPSKRWPLIICLHGSGERGSDPEALRDVGIGHWLADHKLPAIVVSPICPYDDWWMTTSLNRMLDTLQSKYRVDPDRIYLTGLSMGAFGAWAWAIANPERFAALVPMSGGGDPQGAVRLKAMPIWAFHGAKDPTVAVEESECMVNAVNAAGGHAKLTIYPDTGHESWLKAFADPALYGWLLSQHRGPAHAR